MSAQAVIEKILEIPSLDTLTIGQKWHLGLGVAYMIITIIAGVFLFTSVWARKGYEGLDGKLELIEVSKFVSHVIGFLCFLELQRMDTIEPLLTYKYSETRYWLFASGFLGTGILQLMSLFKGIVGKSQNNDNHE